MSDKIIKMMSSTVRVSALNVGKVQEILAKFPSHANFDVTHNNRDRGFGADYFIKITWSEEL